MVDLTLEKEEKFPKKVVLELGIERWKWDRIKEVGEKRRTRRQFLAMVSSLIWLEWKFP